MTGNLRYTTVSRDDDLYEAFPDVCLLSTGRLLCLYRETDTHIAGTSRIMLTESEDRGHSWNEPRPFEVSRSFAESRSVWHDPRIARLDDGRLVVNCAAQIFPDEAESWTFPESRSCYQTFLWFSEDEGKTWTRPHLTEIEGLCADRILPLRDDHWLLAVQRWSIRFPGAMRVHAALSVDGGRTWPLSSIAAEQEGFEHDEPSIIPMPDGRLVCVMRENVHTTRPSHYVLSQDEGRTWSTPRPTPFYGDRPGGGLLKSGRLLVTYRNVEPAPGEKKLGVGRNPGTWAWLGDLAGLEGPGGESRHLEIERDSSGMHGDWGYSAWVQFDDGEVFCVYHHRGDAPKSYIRGCWLREKDFSA